MGVLPIEGSVDELQDIAPNEKIDSRTTKAMYVASLHSSESS
jgi:hypothetical protein